MKLAKTIAWAGALWIGVACAPGAMAQVIKEVPASALFVVKVSDLEATSTKVANYANQLGISQMVQDMATPLDSALKDLGITEGVNRSGDLAGAFIDPDVSGVPSDQSDLLLIPVSDYQKFIGNFPDAKTDGDITQVQFGKPNPVPTFIAHWGDYAALSPTSSIVAKPPTDVIQVDGLTAKELDGKDIVALGNLKELRPKILAEIDKNRQQIASEIDQMITQASAQQGQDFSKYGPLAKELANEILNLGQQFAQSADAASFSLNLSPDGIAGTLMCQFDPASSWGVDVAGVKNTDDSLLEGLAAGKYMLFGGASPQEAQRFWDKYLPPIQKMITDLGPDYSSLNDFLNAARKISLATQSSTFGMPMPSAQAGAGAIFQMVSIRRGDAKAMLEGQRELIPAELAAMKALGVNANNVQMTYTKDARTVNGVSFDEIKGNINMPQNAAGNPWAGQMNEFLKMGWGPNGMDTLTGVVNDQTLLSVQGLDDASLGAAIDAAKSGDDPLAKTNTLKSVSTQLPAQRCSAVYVPLDLWAATGLGYAKMFGIDMGVVLPDNLPPFGMTLSTDGSAVRGDGYMPSQLLQALTTAAMQVYMRTQNVGNQPPAGGAAPGGM